MPSNMFFQTPYFVRHRVAQERYFNSRALPLVVYLLKTARGWVCRQVPRKDQGPDPLRCFTSLFRDCAKRNELDTLFLGKLSGRNLLPLDCSKKSSVNKHFKNVYISLSEFSEMCFRPNSCSQTLQRDPLWVKSESTAKNLGKVLIW